MSLRRAAEIVAGGDVVAFTGAGVSAESGIPTFRDPGGLWERFDPQEFGTWQGVMELAMSRPDELASFLVELRRVIAVARPGPAHMALARLESEGLVRAVITQNVDGLHQEAGSREVVELHGSFGRTVCLRCGHLNLIGRAEFVASLDHAVTGLRTAFLPSLASLLPRCSKCGGPARPDFVGFGEAVHHLGRAEELVRGCRCLLVAGTSGEVFPAARLPGDARAAGAAVVEVVSGRTDIAADVRVRGRAGVALPAIADLAVREGG